ncbi:MAG TPA: D-alanyl-D-alanine carboxypeptidase/D-alanyl-D-alanine-endopeptidase [Candidatus Gastranaerophilaceae bacterium]|nr:D-alanyl-D-alanine carboxypeptidase/D-alanyl-D-alanine-endopeptidase [Candidatus Gastranaerophilaceae bacterium]HPT41937.1 D-alanyl-D-alanine carboxypeptidase/D-alanyl-D-alanine-endopeptidase [Candidatus Gastranaerophilaceae bacterium]
MKKIKLISTFIALFVFAQISIAKPLINPIFSAIWESDLSRRALIGVSIKEVSNGKTAYEMNAKMPMSPASIQKVITLLSSIDTLKENYEFKTELYRAQDGSIYLKLGADPYLTTRDLRELISMLPQKQDLNKPFYIDDSVMDSQEWGEGWQWDDDLNPLMPKFGAYNLDKNLLKINFCPGSQQGAPAEISTEVFYPTAFSNNVTTGSSTEIKLDRKNYISPDVINAQGTISGDYSIEIPINHPRRYFVLRLEEVLRKQKVGYYGEFERMKLPKDAVLLGKISHPISQAQSDILKQSNNMAAETVFKLAGGKYINNAGSAEAGVEMLNNYYKKLGINTDSIKIVDGSGVSKNNLITADFMTNVLVKIAKEPSYNDFINSLAKSGEGTLTDRMLYFKDNLKAKTGTLSNISAITGYLTAKSGKTYAFCIMVNDPKSTNFDKKTFEEYVLRKIYEEL